MKFLINGRVRFVVLLAVALAAVAVVSAGAAPRGANGQITFARFNQTLGDTQVYVVNPDGSGQRLGDTQVYVVNPDGSGQRLVQAPTDTGEFPRGFSDGAHRPTCCPLPAGGSW